MESYKRKNTHFNDPGHAHELTFSCFNRWPLLQKDRPKEWFCKAVNNTSRDLNFSVWAYVIMPEHVHMLVFPNDEQYDISNYLKRVKQSVSRKAKYWLAQHDPVWLDKLSIEGKGQKKTFRFWLPGGGYDRNIVKPGTLMQVIYYLHANPVRRDMVKHPFAWPWSSALDYEGRKDGPINVDLVEAL